MVEPLRHRQTKGAETDMPSLTPPRHIPTLPTAADFHAIRDGPQSTHSSPLSGSSVNTYPSGGRISFGWSMVKISYQAVAQMRPLSPAERRDLRRVLESDELPKSTGSMQDFQTGLLRGLERTREVLGQGQRRRHKRFNRSNCRGSIGGQGYAEYGKPRAT